MKSHTESAHKLRQALRLAILLLAAVCAAPPPAFAAPTESEIHQKALIQARDGRHDAALATLASLVERNPDNPLYLYDYITVLGWAEKDEAALSHLSALDLEAAPAYVLEALGKSARNLKRFPLSIQIYRTAVRRFPARLQSALGLAMSLADNGAHDEATAIITGLRKRHPDHSDVLNTQAYVQIKRRDYFQALKSYEQVLELQPEDRDARRGRILITARLGAPHLAADMAARAPGLLNETELDAMRRDRAAMAIRWGRLPGKDDAPSHADSDRAIATLEARLQRASGDDPATRKRLQYDLMEALFDRQRYSDVIAVYESLDSPPGQVPNQALAAVAGAYLQLKEPGKSLPLLRLILQRNPDDFDTALTLVYAFVDSEDFETAENLITEIAQREPPWKGGKQGAPRKANLHRLQADVTAALVQAFAGDLEDAQSRMKGLLSHAPNNPELRSELGHIYLWRGLPLQALKEFRLAQAMRPGQLNARQGETGARLDLYDFRNSHLLLQRLEQQRPLDPDVRRLQRTWAIHNMRELYLTTGYGKSTGVQEGSEDFNMDAWLYSQPLKYRYRPFLYTHYATARFPEGDAQYGRLGVGLEYRRRGYQLISTLTRNDDDSSVNAGLALNGLWKPGDHWRLAAGYDSNSNDIPLRGRLNEQVEGWSGNLDITYYFHESRRIGAGIQYLDFSDGNIRKNARATIFQRLITRPHYKLDGTAGVYASTNTRDITSYFNPGKDLNLDITLVNEWLQFRHYERAFRHRLGLSLGSYYQESFGAKGIGSLFYEQQWNPNDTFEISYGISRARKAYDGNMENHTRLYLTLDWRF